MNVEPIKAILKNELGDDLMLLCNFIETKNYDKLYEFAHRYKLRLFYIDETKSLNIITHLTKAYINEDFILQLKFSKELQLRLIEIDEDLNGHK